MSTDTSTKHIRELLVPHQERVGRTLELATLGQNSRIILHDLSNQLTALSLSVLELENHLEQNRHRKSSLAKANHKTSLRRSRRVRKNIEYVTSVLRSHLCTSKQKQRDMNTCRTAFDPAKEILCVTRLFGGRAVLENVRFRVQVRKDILLIGDNVKFAYTITNLITNAFDSFSKSNQRNRKIISITLTESMHEIQITVSDNGCGIPAKVKRKINSGSHTTKPHGNGIGLQSVRGYIQDELGGELRIESDSSGSSFHLNIPSIYRARNGCEIATP
jgi:C4-dicarboxylate-specific signal transduction histidine kinase